jgi:hypothetical protein
MAMQGHEIPGFPPKNQSISPPCRRQKKCKEKEVSGLGDGIVSTLLP